MQWSKACSDQMAALDDAKNQVFEAMRLRDDSRDDWVMTLKSSCHYFAVAAFKLQEHLEWAIATDAFANSDLAVLLAFDKQDIKDVRDMREHGIEYLKGRGRFPERFFKQGEHGRSSAHSLTGNLIGGRLDYVAFGKASSTLYETLRASDVPYPSQEATMIMLRRNVTLRGN